MPTVGHAQFDITGNNTQAIRAIQQIRAEALKQLGNLTIGVNAGSIGPAIQAAIKSAQAQVAVTLKPVTQAQVDAALGKVQGSKQIDVSLTGDALTRLAEIKAKLTELKTTTTSMLTVDVSSVERVIQALKQQIADLRALQSQIPNRPNPNLPGQGGGGGGPPNAGVSQLQRDLQIIQSQYDRGAVGLRTYLREMERIRTAGQGMAAGLQAGSREAQQLERVMSGLNRNAQNLNNTSITKIRSDLAAARAEFERATVAAGRFGDTRQALRTYEQAMAALEQRIQSVGQRSSATQAQLRALNQLSSQLGSQRNAIQGSFTPISLAGNVQNALRSLPQFAAQMGGSLGAAFSSVQQLTGGLGSLTAAAGPLGTALGGIVAVTAALALGLPAAYRQMDTLAAETSKAATTLKIYQLTVARTGQDQDAAAQLVTNLANRFKLLPETVQDAVTQLLRAKFSVSQIETVLTGAGASAIAFGRDAKAGFEGVTSAALTQTSAALNAIGVAENLQPAYIKAAKALGTTADKLNEVQKNQVLVNLISKATAGEVAVLREMMGGYAGKQGDVNLATGQLRRELGEAFLPTVLQVKDAQLELIQDTIKLVQEFRRSGPVVQELKGYLTALLGVLLVIKAQAIGAGVQAGWAALGATWTRLIGIIPALTGGLTGLAGAQAALNASIAASPVIIAAAVAALAVYSTKLIADTQRAYDAADQSNQNSTQMVLDRVRKLRQEGTELARAQAQYLLALERQSQARQGQVVGTKWTGERIIKVDAGEVARADADVKRLSLALKDAQRNAALLAAEDARRGEIAKQVGAKVGVALKLTDDQLKTQKATIRDIQAELSKPLKVFGGTEFQNQLDQIGQKYDELRNKLRQDVLDPAQRNALSRQLLARQEQEKGNTRTEYQGRASDAAGAAERQAQQLRVSAMQEGSAKIRAQLRLDLTDLRRNIAEQVKAWTDFPKEVARIRAAGSAQASQMEAQANRNALKADQDAAKARADEAKRIADEARRVAAEKKQQADELARQIETAARLGRQFFNLNQDFGLKWSQGSVTAQQLQDYQQAVAGLRSEVEKLPQDQQDRFKGLFGQAAELDRRGQALVSIKDQIKEVTDRLGQMTVAELQNARAQWASVPAAEALVKAIDKRLPIQQNAEYKASLTSLQNALADMSDAELQNRLAAEKGSDAQGKRIKLLETEIETRRKLRDATLEQGRLTLQKGDAQAVVDDYEAKKNAAQGNNQKLLELERTVGAEVLAARQRLAQVAAREEILQVQEKYRALILEAQKHGQDITELESQRDALIGQARAKRDATQLVNAQQSDKALIDQTKSTTTELLKLESERQDGIDAISKGRSENQVGGYDLASNQAGEDLTKRLQAEQDYGQQVVAARENIARLAAQAEIRQQTAAYQTRIDAAEGNADEQKRLEDELAAWISNRNIALGVELEGIALDVKNKRIAAEEALKNAILQINRDLIDGLNQRAQSEAGRKTSQFESDLAQELRAVGDNEQAKLDILIREQGVRMLLAQQEINARMTSEREAENRRFEDLKTRLQKEGTWAQNSERLEADHQARLTEIASQGEFDKAQKVLAIRTQTEDQAGKVQEKRAQDQVKAITKGLSDMSVEQRSAASTSLQGWLDTFNKMGVAGAAAAKAIQTALDNVASSDSDARARASKLADEIFRVNPDDPGSRYMRPDQFQAQFSQDLGKIGKPEDQQDAIDKAKAQYDPLIKSLKELIGKAEKIRTEFTGRTDLNAVEQQQLNAANAFLPLYEKALSTTESKSAEAGTKAGNAFVDAQVKELAKLQSEMVKAQDSAADSALQLAEANLKVAQSKGLEGTRDYLAALQAYRDYWKGRMGVLAQGLADAKQKETDARADLAGLSATATTEQRTAATTALNTAITATSQAQADLNQATTNYVTGQEKVIDVDQQRIDGQKALRQSQSQLASLLGRTAISYQSELDSLDELIKKYPAQALELGKVRAEYERIQTIRQRGISADSLKLDFKIGFDGGGQRLTDTVSGVAQGLGSLTNPLSLLAMVLEKLNIVGTITDALFSALEEPMKALQEPLKILGEILGSLIGANLRMLAPILEAVVTVFAALYDAIAEFINAITFGLYDIRRKDPNDSPSARRELADSKAQNDQTQLGIDYRKGLISFEEYEAGKLKLFKEGLDRQEAADIEAANGNEAKIAEIRRKYAQQWETEQLDSADRVHQHALEGIDEQVKRGLLTEKEGAEKKYALNVEYLNRQRNAAIAAANGDQEKILAINKKYDGLILDSKREMLDKVNAAYKGITDGLMSSVIGGTKDLLMNALKGMNFGAFRQGFRQQFRQALFDAVVSAAIEGAALQGILQPAMDALKEAFASGNEAQIDQALNGVLQAGSKAEAALARIFPRLAKLGQKLGIGTGEQDSTLTVTGQIQAPEVKISLDALAMLADVINERIPKYTDAINLHVPALQASTETLRVQVPAFSSAVDQFGLHEAAYQQQFGANVSAFGGYVSEFGQHVRVLAGAAAATQNAKPLTTTTSGGGYVPVSKR